MPVQLRYHIFGYFVLLGFIGITYYTLVGKYQLLNLVQQQKIAADKPSHGDLNACPVAFNETDFFMSYDTSKGFFNLQIAAKSKLQCLCEHVGKVGVTFWERPEIPAMSKVDMSTEGIKYFIYAITNNDAVSFYLIRGDGWETKRSAPLIGILSRFAQKHKLSHSETIFLDIGANLGTFSLPLASHNFSIIAFEPMIDNYLYLARSFCEQPQLRERLTLFNFGLGKQDQTCTVYTENVNSGNGVVSCIENFKAPSQFTIRSKTTIKRLDDVIDDPHVRSRIGAIKIDVEGFEHFVVMGGMEVMLQLKVPAIVSENPRNLVARQGGDPRKLLQLFVQAGYVISATFEAYEQNRSMTLEETMLFTDDIVFIHDETYRACCY